MDGTLLNATSRLSPYTVATINDLTARGLVFSYATARSYVTASKVTAPLDGRFPIVTYNGTFVVENGTGRRLFGHFLPPDHARYLLDILMAHDIYPTVFADLEGRERMTYCPAHLSEGMRAFRAGRTDDPRSRTVNTPAALYEGEIFYISCIDTPEKLLPVYHRLKDAPHHRCLYYSDPLSGTQWLEFTPVDATKAGAALALKAVLGCERLVCFGDGINDLPLFEVADEAYAMANAHLDVKAAATAVIGSNDEEGVARWLAAHVGI